MEEEIARLRKNNSTELIIRKTDFRGVSGIDIREYLTTAKFTGWTRNGVRIPSGLWKEFKEKISNIEL